MAIGRTKRSASRLTDWRIWILGAVACAINFGCKLPSPTTVELLTNQTAQIGTVASDANPEKAAVPASGDVVVFGGVDAALHSNAQAEFFDPIAFGFTPTGKIKVSSAVFCSTLLPNLNEFFVAGGLSGKAVIRGYKLQIKANAVDSAELYKTADASFSLAPNTMNEHRAGCTATVFLSGPLQGEVLITGGVDENGTVLDSAELYNPADGSFTPASNTMSSPRALHTATLLTDGTVLVAGGFSDITQWDTTASADIFDPSTGKFSATGPLGIGRAGAAAVLVSGAGTFGGDVLIAGGIEHAANFLTSVGTGELYCPASSDFCSNFPLKEARALLGANDLGNDQILLTGGFNGSAKVKNGQLKNAVGLISNSAEVVDLSTSSPSSSCFNGPKRTFGCKRTMVKARAGHVATEFTFGPGGQILISGGVGGPSTLGPFAVLKSAECIDLGPKKSEITHPMATARVLHGAFLVP